jgi:hypothetical protein
MCLCAGSGPALDEEFHGPVEGLFLFLGEIAGGQFAPLPVVVQAFATDAVLVAVMGAGTILLVDFRSWALILLFHDDPSGHGNVLFDCASKACVQ